MKISNKKILFIILLIIVIIVFCFIFFYFSKKNNKKETFTTFNSTDNSFSIIVSDNLNLKQDIGNESFNLILKSDSSDNSIHISTHDYTDLFDITDIINSDKSNFVSQFENVNNITDITEYTENNMNYYSYSFNYSNNKLMQVYWLKLNNKFYIFDFNIDLDSRDNLKDYVPNILSSFKLL